MNDGMDTFKAGRNRYVALCAFVGKAESASPKLKRRGDRFRRALDERQKRSFAKILAHPRSKAYHDYVEVPASFGVEA